jgi:hypothetical protein
MDWLNTLKDWGAANAALFWWLFAGSLALLVLTPVIAGWFILRLPADYFQQESRRPLSSWNRWPLVRWPMLVAKNLLGIVLLVAGVLMLVAPGQGLLTIAMGIVLIDFPGKFRLERWVVTRPNVWRTLNWLRRRARRPELQRPA